MFNIAIDWLILDYIQMYWRNNFLDGVMLFISKLGNQGVLWILLALLLLCRPQTRRLGLVVALSLFLEAICCNLLLKPVIARPRPCVINTNILLLLPPPADFSFPSGHTGAAFAATSALIGSRSRWGIPTCLLAVLMGFSRIYLYVHYPSDVLGGMILGSLCGWLSRRIISAAIC